MPKTGYEQTSVDTIRQMLRDKGIDEEFLKNTKTALVAKLLELEQEGEPQQDPEPEDENLEGLLQEAEEETDDGLQPYTEEEAARAEPAFGSEHWAEFVMNQFAEDELKGEQGAPSADGCRRVAEQLLGPIMVITVPANDGPTTVNNGTATVIVHVEIRITRADHPAHGNTLIREDIADVNHDNCDHPYHKHPSATAMTRAEGRIFRKLLGLRNIITAEEASQRAEDTDVDTEWTPSEPITEAQITVMDTMCRRLDINVMPFVNSGRNQYESIYHVTKVVASRMIKELNKFQRSKKDVPEGIQGYDPNWKSTQNEQGS